MQKKKKKKKKLAPAPPHIHPFFLPQLKQKTRIYSTAGQWHSQNEDVQKRGINIEATIEMKIKERLSFSGEKPLKENRKKNRKFF